MNDDKVAVNLSEYAQHLRLIHFTIILTCFAFCVVAGLSDSGDVEYAFQDSRLVARVAPQLNNGWFEGVVLRSLHDQGVDLSPAATVLRCEIEISDHKEVVFVKLPQRSWVANPLSDAETFASNPDFHLQSVADTSLVPVDNAGLRSMVLSSPTNLEQFAALWNRFAEPANIYVVTRLPETALVSLSTPYSSTLTWPATLTRSEEKRADVLLQFERTAAAEGAEIVLRGTGQLEMGDEISEITITTRPGIETLRVPIQAAIAKTAEQEWPNGTFEYSFRDLDAVTGTYRRLDLPDVVTVLASERLRTSEQLEFLGSKIPSRALTRIGVFVLAALQLYFLLHLRHITKALEYCTHYSLNVAWIGLYSDQLSVLVTRVSAFAAPITACYLLSLYIAQYGFGHSLSYVLFLTTLWTCGAGVAVTRELLKLRKYFLRPG